MRESLNKYLESDDVNRSIFIDPEFYIHEFLAVYEKVKENYDQDRSEEFLFDAFENLNWQSKEGVQTFIDFFNKYQDITYFIEFLPNIEKSNGEVRNMWQDSLDIICSDLKYNVVFGESSLEEKKLYMLSNVAKSFSLNEIIDNCNLLYSQLIHIDKNMSISDIHSALKPNQEETITLVQFINSSEPAVEFEDVPF